MFIFRRKLFPILNTIFIYFIYLAKTYIVFTVYQAMMLNIFQHLDVLPFGSTNLVVSVFRYRLKYKRVSYSKKLAKFILYQISL